MYPFLFLVATRLYFTNIYLKYTVSLVGGYLFLQNTHHSAPTSNITLNDVDKPALSIDVVRFNPADKAVFICLNISVFDVSFASEFELERLVYRVWDKPPVIVVNAN